jgi:hypothetical protein
MLDFFKSEEFWTPFAFSVFLLTPVLLNIFITTQEKIKDKINHKLALHGLRLKQR